MKHSLRWLVLLVLFLTTISTSSAQDVGTKVSWNWSKPGEHHKSVVRILARESANINAMTSWFQGNGVYISYGKLTGILTAQHVIGKGRHLQIIKQDGSASEFCTSSFKDKDGHDIAFIPYVDKKLKPVELSPNPPKVGKCYEAVGLIGDDTAVRAFYTNSIKPDLTYMDSYDSFSLSGDSGSPIFDDEQRVVGIYATGGTMEKGEESVTHVWARGVNRGINSPKYSLIVAFLNRLQTVNMQFG